MLDTLHGYFQLPLDKDSQLLTAFLLPQGKFYYKVAPMGLSPSGDWWCQRSDEALAGLPGVLKLVDDILVQAPTKEELLQRIRQVLQRCQQHGMILSKRKLEIGQEVSFAGHIVRANGVRPDPVRLDAISNFPTPTYVTALRSFLGLANQLGTYLPDLAAASTRLHVLLRKNVSWVWTPEHDDEFNALKKLLTSTTIVKHFDPSLRSVIFTDASAASIGFALVQHGPDGTPRLISCGSSLNPAEKRYAPVELEALGAVFAIQKCSFYMLGSPTTFTLITDHQPLIRFFQWPLNECTNSRLQRLRLKVVGANVRFEWQAGKHKLIADTLSRFPVSPKEPMDSAEMEEDRAFIRRTITSNDGGLAWLCDAADEDPTYQEIVKAKYNSSPVNHLPIDLPARAFRNMWEFISVEEGFGSPLIYDGTRIIVPPSARSRVLDLLHIPHAGQVKTKKASQQLYYWPGMNAAIHDRIAGCEVCTEALPSKPPAAPLDPPASTSEPMQAVGMDLFAAGNSDYLVMVDRHSGYPWVHRLTTTTSLAVTRAVKKWFEYFGLNKSIRSDGGPQFRGEAFKKTNCNDNSIFHEASSPYNPESNGLAEAAIKNFKKLLIKCIKEGTDFQAALAEFHNCPRADGCSPAHIIFRRGTRGRLPSLPAARNLPAADADAVVERRQASYAEVAARKRIPAVFSLAQQVWVQDPLSGKWNSQAEVMSRQGSSYTISFAGGSVSRRNERFLRPVKIHEGEGEQKNDEDECAYSNANMNLPADSTDPASRPAPADVDSSLPSDDGGEKYSSYPPSLPHSLAPHAGLHRSARLQKRSEDSVCLASQAARKRRCVSFPKSMYAISFTISSPRPPPSGCRPPMTPRSILTTPRPSIGPSSTSSSRAPSSSSASSTTSSTAAAPNSSPKRSSTTGRSASYTRSTSSPAGPPTTPPTERSSASSPTSATP